MVISDDDEILFATFELDQDAHTLCFLAETEDGYYEYGFLIPIMLNIQSYINKLLDVEVVKVKKDRWKNNLDYEIMVKDIGQEFFSDFTMGVVTSIECEYNLDNNRATSLEVIDSRQQCRNITCNNDLGE